jgi:hypothetical protein
MRFSFRFSFRLSFRLRIRFRVRIGFNFTLGAFMSIFPVQLRNRR